MAMYILCVYSPVLLYISLTCHTPQSKREEWCPCVQGVVHTECNSEKKAQTTSKIALPATCVSVESKGEAFRLKALVLYFKVPM